MIAAEAGVEGFHGVHFSLSGRASRRTFCFQGILRVAECVALIVRLELLLIKVCKGIVDFTGCPVVPEDGVDGKTESDYFDGHETGKEPRYEACK